MTLHEPAVALTDYGLALECALFVRLLRGRQARLWRVFFAATGLAAFAGGTAHGLLQHAGAARAVVWQVTLLAIGAAAVAAWVIGARVLGGPAAGRPAAGAGGLLYSAYAAVVLLVSQAFTLAVLFYLPAALLLGAAFTVAWRRGRPGAGAGLAGVLVTLAAAALREAGVGFHPVRFPPDALFHVVQGAGLFLLYRAARRE